MQHGTNLASNNYRIWLDNRYISTCICRNILSVETMCRQLKYIPLIFSESSFYYAVARGDVPFSQFHSIIPIINSSPVFHIRSRLLFAGQSSERYLRRWLQSAIFFVERYRHAILIKHLWVLRVSRCGHRLSANSWNYRLYVCARAFYVSVSTGCIRTDDPINFCYICFI